MENYKSIQQGKIREAIVDCLANMPLFKELKGPDLAIIANYMNIIDLKEDDTVFKEGDKGDYVCFVVDGKLDVMKKSDKGSDCVINTLSKGRSIGEMSIIDDFPRSATIKAHTKATLVTLNRERFNYILEQHPKIGIKLLKGIARLLSLHLRRTSGQLADTLLSK